jgi:hypothetical protein
MSPPLVREALSISAELDKRFGMITRAAKMTDVPGHTLGLVPLLADAGVRFLHIGVNSASMPPEVPPVFRWRAQGGQEVLVVYQSEYGATFVPEELRDGIAFAHTMDNIGPQNVGHVIDSFFALSEANPGFDIKASTLEDFGEILWSARDSLPLVTNEIADTWIHGVGSAPARVSRFLAARRAYDDFAGQGLTPRRKLFGRKLMEVAEHTWGVDIKTYLRDEVAWDRPAFAAARKNDPRFAFVEAAWAEQDGIIDAAICALDEADRSAVAGAAEPEKAERNLKAIKPGKRYVLAGYALEFGASTGALIGLRRDDDTLLEASQDGPGMFHFSYESYDGAGLDEYRDSYLTARHRWGVQDFGKPGLGNASTAQSGHFASADARIANLGDDAIGILTKPDQMAHQTLGAPKSVHTIYRVVDDALRITVSLFDKPANRMPEAGFLDFAPVAVPQSWTMRKLGQDISPLSVIEGGNRQLHAVDAVSADTPAGQRFTIETFDAPLFCPGGQPFFPFTRQQPNMMLGGRFNLFNNKWGTNFSMWCEGNLAFRFILRLSE